MRRIICILSLTAAMAFLVLGCQAAPEATATPSTAATPTRVTTAPATAMATTPTPAAEKPRRGGTFRPGFPGDISDFDPHASRTSQQHGKHVIYDKLLTLTQGQELAPQLVEAWQLSSDGLSVTLKLRKGVKFQDGTDFNARAAKFSLDRALTIEPKAASYSDVEAIKEVELVDDSTIRLKLKTTSGTILFGLAEEGGMVVSPAAVEKWGKDFPLHPIGTGPYEFVEWVKNDHYTVKRFDGYWDKDKAGFFDQMVYRTVPDDTTRLAALRAGQLDYTDTIPVKDIPTLQADPNITFAEVPGWGYYYIKMHNGKPPFDNKALRQAMAYAIDRETIIKTVFQGHGVVAKGPLAPTSWAYKEGNVQGYDFNLDKAKQKLAEAGLPTGLKFKLQVPITSEFQQACQVMQAQLAKVGIEAEIDLKDVSTGISLVSQGDYQAWCYRWTGYLDPHRNIFANYHPKGTNTARNNTPDANILLEKAAEATDLKERARLYQEAEKILVENSTEVWYMYYMENAAVRKNVKGLKPLPSRYYTSRFFGTAWFTQ